jgi:hypothetical protein
MVRILTETIGTRRPCGFRTWPIACSPGRLPYPILPQEWHFRRSIDYSITANRAILDLAARNRENFLFNIYRMGKNSIERGSRDSWTMTASRVAAGQSRRGPARRRHRRRLPWRLGEQL